MTDEDGSDEEAEDDEDTDSNEDEEMDAEMMEERDSNEEVRDLKNMRNRKWRNMFSIWKQAEYIRYLFS